MAACLVIGATVNASSPSEFAAARLAIASISRYLLMPSLVLVLITGLLAMVATESFKLAGWAWLKALLGLSVFEATLVTIGSSTQRVVFANDGGASAGLVASLLQSERNTIWLLLGLCVANVVLAIWRPRLTVEIR